MNSFLAVLAASLTTFAVTNIDDVFLLTLFFARGVPTRRIVAGQYLEPPTSANQPGAFSILTTADGAQMVVSYASQPVGASQSHTGTQVRIAAQGPQAANVTGITDQTELFQTIARALDLEE